MSLDTKYRPDKFSDVVGQQDTVSVLRELLKRGQVFEKSYVFAGPSGTGKTTTARILARAMLCSDLNTVTYEPCNDCPSCKEIMTRGASFAFTEMDAANNTGADNIRRIIEGLEYFTLDGGDRKIYLIDECHALSKVAMDALLKPMEDSIPGTKDKRLVVLFCTTEPQKLRGTIKSRCLVFNIKEPTRDDMIKRLRFIADEENIAIDDESLDVIFGYGQGHIRDMVNALERVSRVLPTKDQGTDPDTGKIVRQQLGLSVVEKEYEVLLYLKDNPSKSIEILIDAMMQADAHSIYSGIADASLASFRHKKGITIGLTYIEKDLCTQIAQKYEDDDLLNVAHHIMNTPKKVDRNALMCELLVIHSKLKSGTLGHMVLASSTSAPTSAPTVAIATPVVTVATETVTVAPSPAMVEKVNREHAQKQMAYGASAARGQVIPPAQEDPVKVFEKSRTSVRTPPTINPLLSNRRKGIVNDD